MSATSSAEKPARRHSVKLAAKARRDIEEHAHYYAEHASQRVAEGFEQELARNFALLASHPKTGPLMAGGRRRIPFGGSYPFNIWYRLRGVSVWIIRVVHQRQDYR